MSETEDQSSYGRGFVAACIVIAAVLLCGALLLITGLSADPSSASTTPAQTVVASEPSGQGCSLDAGDQAIPAKAPAVDGWDVSRRVVVPRSSSYGPGKTDADGFRRCFAHSPTGAVFAAYSAIAALADVRQAIPTVEKLMVPGPNTQALLRVLAAEEPSTDSGASQLAGYRILDAARDRVTIMLAVPVESAYVSLTLTLIWYDGDWRLQSPSPGEAVGAPYSQLRDLGGFVVWSGV